MTVMPFDPQDKQRVIQLNFCGEICELWADGALYLPSYKTWLSLICTLKRDMQNLL